MCALCALVDGALLSGCRCRGSGSKSLPRCRLQCIPHLCHNLLALRCQAGCVSHAASWLSACLTAHALRSICAQGPVGR